jgi:hypothetical protein
MALAVTQNMFILYISLVLGREDQFAYFLVGRDDDNGGEV